VSSKHSLPPHIIIDLKKYVIGYIQYSIPPPPSMPHKKLSLFKNTTDGDSTDSVEASYKFVPNDKHILIHCERTCCYYVFDTCDEMVAFLSDQKKDNLKLLNYHELIRGQSYQKLRFDIDAPIEFLEHILSDFEKPKLEAKLAMPEPTGLDLIDSLEFGLYEEKLAEVRCYNEYITNTSLNDMHGVHLMTHIKMAITKAFAELYYGKVNMLDIPANVEENFLVFDSSDETKFLRHIIIPGVHLKIKWRPRPSLMKW